MNDSRERCRPAAIVCSVSNSRENGLAFDRRKPSPSNQSRSHFGTRGAANPISGTRSGFQNRIAFSLFANRHHDVWRREHTANDSGRPKLTRWTINPASTNRAAGPMRINSPGAPGSDFGDSVFAIIRSRSFDTETGQLTNGLGPRVPSVCPPPPLRSSEVKSLSMASKRAFRTRHFDLDRLGSDRFERSPVFGSKKLISSRDPPMTCRTLGAATVRGEILRASWAKPASVVESTRTLCPKTSERPCPEWFQRPFSLIRPAAGWNRRRRVSFESLCRDLIIADAHLDRIGPSLRIRTGITCVAIDASAGCLDRTALRNLRLSADKGILESRSTQRSG